MLMRIIVTPVTQCQIFKESKKQKGDKQILERQKANKIQQTRIEDDV